MANIAIFGAYSAIAEATARRLASAGHRFFLIGRDREMLNQLAADLTVRGAGEAQTFAADLSVPDEMRASVDALYGTFDGLDIALLAHGTLPDQRACEADADLALAALDVNARSPIALLTLLAGRFEQQGRGSIAVITSVAGERGRKSNYVYGAAKGAVSIFLQGLRHRMAATGVTVIDIRPGFVDTPMTAAFDKGPLWATPDRVAADILRAIDRGTPVVYTPWFWRYVMLVIRNLPAFILHRTNL